MMTLDMSALSLISPEHGLSDEEIRGEEENIVKFLKKIEARKQGFYTDEVLANEVLITQIENYARSVEGKYESVVVLGIGGSALGVHTLREAFGNFFGKESPRFFIVDNIDPSLIRECEEEIELSKTLFIVITKSGGTPETLSQYFYFSQKIADAGLYLSEHMVCITDAENGFLREQVHLHNLTAFPIPENVGGRFSVLTSVGLVPAALMGIDIRALLAGANMMRDQFLASDLEGNMPFQLATIQYLLAEKGKRMNVMYAYSHKLFRLADWYRQLLAESIGKELNSEGYMVHTGITPINALGVTDQHSQSQLYMEGPFDKLIVFLEVDDFGVDGDIPLPDGDDARVEFLRGVSFGQLMRTEKRGTADALTKKNRPHITIRISEMSEENMGALFLLFEGATAFLGEYYGINAFDQPGVELSKNLTKQMLLEREEQE